jgi:hypothetical protein
MKLALLLVLTLLSTAPAATISTLGSAHAAYTDATWNFWVGQAFQVTSMAPASLVTSVSVPVIVYDPNVNFVVRVVGSLSTNPNAPDLANVRATLSSSGSQVAGTTVQLLELTPKAGEPIQPVEADKRYWVIMGNADPDHNQTNAAGRYAWSYTNTMAPAAGPTDELAMLNVVAESGTAGTGWTVLNQSPQRLGISLVPVPEPGIAGLLLIATGLIFRRLR